MADCDKLREILVLTKGARNAALKDNAQAENDGRLAPYWPEEIDQLRMAVDAAASAARRAGCDISDLVGPAVGNPDARPVTAALTRDR